ncbi:MAG: hypothetical protein HDQ88_08285 [Clostridia bacterium]|nr:hypothetical protein [Clostridia bacterium]
MIRDQYSYWLTARPLNGQPTLNDLLGLVDDLNVSGLAAPDGPMSFGIQDDKEVFGDVEYGSVEEDNDLKPIVIEMSKRHPDYEFTFDELDEDDHSEGRTTKLVAGVVTYEGYRRTLDPGEYDAVTVSAVTDYLEENGFADAANAIRTKFK